MLIFDASTGSLKAILLDEGYLTNVRTAIAGAIVAKYMAPKKVEKIEIIGTGTQAKLQLQYLRNIINCEQVFVWGRSENSLIKFKQSMSDSGYFITTTKKVDDIIQQCNFIVTTTPSTFPLIANVEKGTHITAIGSDTAQKQELEAQVFSQASFIVTDSLTQCQERGELHHALKKNIITLDRVHELGKILSQKLEVRKSADDFTIADLTGLAVQDIQIARAVYLAWKFHEI